jgi:hypothetical protein
LSKKSGEKEEILAIILENSRFEKCEPPWCSEASEITTQLTSRMKFLKTARKRDRQNTYADKMRISSII